MVTGIVIALRTLVSWRSAGFGSDFIKRSAHEVVFDLLTPQLVALRAMESVANANVMRSQ